MHLARGSDYVTAVTQTLLGGGDTDTNACIVGALVGAATGVDGIPADMQAAVMACSPAHRRPQYLHPNSFAAVVGRLLASGDAASAGGGASVASPIARALGH
jgi:hypothetical protein